MARSCPIQGIFLSDRNLPPERQEHARVKNVLLAVFHRADEFIILPPGRKLGFFIIIGPQHRIHEADSASHDSQRQKQTARRLRQNAQNRKLQIIPCRQKPRQSLPVPFRLHNRHETIGYISGGARNPKARRKPAPQQARSRLRSSRARHPPRVRGACPAPPADRAQSVRSSSRPSASEAENPA
ncbi:Hypothetical protein GOX1667 [Gluconobacter oxydans 621H]|uniref:Uncharacterized protein n=1 Tax=Gluconobacter oxydans (strain 621H) TaxID=290633 RepID=Q5FQD8_GLUOX|nr:Hypothetical protein GOX1667 [Gluconobacter oxydans 621H]